MGAGGLHPSDGVEKGWEVGAHAVLDSVAAILHRAASSRQKNDRTGRGRPSGQEKRG
jgi:hypothetical protein